MQARKEKETQDFISPLTENKNKSLLIGGAVLTLLAFFIGRATVSKGPERFELESLKIAGKNRNFETQTQKMSGWRYRWNNDTQAYIRGVQPGDWIDYVLPSRSAGRYRLFVEWTKAVDYGTIRVFVNGKSVGEPVDLWSTEVLALGPMYLGEFDAVGGENKIRFEVIGKNRNAQAHNFGIDGIRLERR